MKKYIFYILGILFLYACSEEEIKTFSGERYLSFANSVEEDSVKLSFMFYPGQAKISVPLEVCLTGKPVKEDLSYSLKVYKNDDNPKNTTNSPAKCFKLPENLIFEAGKIKDTLEVEIINADELKSNEYTLIVEISQNENFIPGVFEKRFAKIVFCDKLSRPSWWDKYVEWYYLGEYSDAKFNKFMEVTGVGDLSKMEQPERRVYYIQFKYYLKAQKEAGTPVLEDNGAEMEVPILG